MNYGQYHLKHGDSASSVLIFQVKNSPHIKCIAEITGSVIHNNGGKRKKNHLPIYCRYQLNSVADKKSEKEKIQKNKSKMNVNSI